MARTWVELILPLYSAFAVFIYFQPGALPTGLEENVAQKILVLLMWTGMAALSGILAISALFLSFYLLYSPFYLLSQMRRLGGPGRWVDRRELRFYLWCFLLLCLLGSLAIANPTAAFVTFTLLAGSAQLLWRVLI